MAIICKSRQQRDAVKETDTAALLIKGVIMLGIFRRDLIDGMRYPFDWMLILMAL